MYRKQAAYTRNSLNGVMAEYPDIVVEHGTSLCRQAVVERKRRVVDLLVVWIRKVPHGNSCLKECTQETIRLKDHAQARNRKQA